MTTNQVVKHWEILYSRTLLISPPIIERVLIELPKRNDPLVETVEKALVDAGDVVAMARRIVLADLNIIFYLFYWSSILQSFVF